MRQKRRRDTPPSSPPSTAERANAIPSRRSRRVRPWWWLVAAAVALGALFAWYAKRPPRTEAEARAALARKRPAPSALNLVVVTLDTTRADRLGCYGFRGVETPAIDALAREGVVFEHSTATVPLTFPSHSSIFTGLVPPHHGVRDNGGFFLDEAKVTLAERLKGAGFVDGRVRGRVGARVEVGPRAGVRRVLGHVRPLEVQGGLARHRAEAGRRGDGRRARMARDGEAAPLLRLGPPLRPAHALRPAGALRLALPEPAVSRRDRLHRPGRRPAHQLAARAGAHRAHARRAHGRPRREPRRARRVDARLFHLRRHDARAARRSARPGECAAGAPCRPRAST